MDQSAIKPLQGRLEEHPVYAKVQDLSGLRVFMQHHVFSVWDFMSLLKALQRELAPAETPWLPGRFASAQRSLTRSCWKRNRTKHRPRRARCGI